jgi:coproporphyrinogen III oxidase
LDRKQSIIEYLLQLRNSICEQFESIEADGAFQRTKWDHHSGGGGEISLIRGKTFEKAAVNWSAVHGPNFPMNDGSGPFFATGVSLITHMSNPHAPTVHMNVRYIETKDRWWFGGGYDLTPMGFPYEEDTLHFHSIAQKTLDPFGNDIYPAFAKSAQDYFFIPHRKKERGVGGIFFDQLNSGNFERDHALWQQVGNTFIDAVLPIYKKRIEMPFTDDQRHIQLQARAHYVEFNLMYDRGTKFGFQSGGNPEAILCSMPPLVKW